MAHLSRRFGPWSPYEGANIQEDLSTRGNRPLCIKVCSSFVTRLFIITEYFKYF